MGLKIGEAFVDRCLLTVTATGARATLLADVTCQVYDEAGVAFGAAIVATEGADGWYYASFTPDAAGTWATDWSKTANPEDYTFHYPYKEFMVGAGQEADIDALHDVPAQNAVANTNLRDIVGNKTDDPTWFTDDTSSLMRFSKAAVATGGGLSYSGKCDTGMGASTTIIVCDDLKGFGDDFFNTDWVMTVNLNNNAHGVAPEGNAPRDITDYVSATGTFTVAAFSANVEEDDKIIVQKRNLHHVDKVAIAAIPTTDSFAYKVSQFVADGDGDFATGTALPSNTSLYDILAGANGLAAWPGAAVPANNVSIAEVIQWLYTRLTNHLVTRTWFSDPQEEVAVTNAAGDKSLPSVTLPDITGTIVAMYAGVKFRMVENTNSAANKLNGNQDVQVNKAGGAWTDAVALKDDMFTLGGYAREGGDCLIGNLELNATLTGAFNAVYNFQWDEAVADVSNLQFNDVQTFLIVSYY